MAAQRVSVAAARKLENIGASLGNRREYRPFGAPIEERVTGNPSGCTGMDSPASASGFRLAPRSGIPPMHRSHDAHHIAAKTAAISLPKDTVVYKQRRRDHQMRMDTSLESRLARPLIHHVTR